MADSIDNLLSAVRAFVDQNFPGEQSAALRIEFTSGRKSFVCTVPPVMMFKPNAVKPERVVPTEDEGEDCEESDSLPRSRKLRRLILGVFEDIGERRTTSKLLAELIKREIDYGDRHLQTILSDMVKDGLLDNGKDDRGRGYGLVEWPVGEADE